MNGSPSGVPGGTGGQAAATGSPWALGLGVVGLLGLAVAALQLLRRRTVTAR
jgi:hypothetical protein